MMTDRYRCATIFYWRILTYLFAAWCIILTVLGALAIIERLGGPAVL